MQLPHRTPASEASSADSRLIPASHVVSVVHGTRTVLLDPLRGQYYGLDEVGGRIWDLAKEGITGNEIVDVLEDEFNATREQIEQDLDRLVKDLKRRRLMQVMP